MTTTEQTVAAPDSSGLDSPATRALWAIKDCWTIVMQEFTHVVRQPSTFAWQLGMPVVMVLMFVYVFGSAMDVTGQGAGVDRRLFVGSMDRQVEHHLRLGAPPTVDRRLRHAGLQSDPLNRQTGVAMQAQELTHRLGQTGVCAGAPRIARCARLLLRHSNSIQSCFTTTLRSVSHSLRRPPGLMQGAL